MQLRHKVVLLGVVPLVLAAAVLAFVVDREGTALLNSQISSVEPVLLRAKEDQLVKVVELALNAVPELLQPARIPRVALAKLEKLKFGESEDGYFYIYEIDTGVCVLNPHSPLLQGKDQSQLRDDQGQLVMPPLFAQARSEAGRGFVRYRWHRPSQQNSWRPKLGYVVRLPGNWMLGTGVYVDDLEATLAQLRASSATTIRNTMIGIAVIAVLAMLAVAAVGLVLNVSQQRIADSNLQRLTRKVLIVQEEERARVSRFLHDEAIQELVAVKFTLETALITPSAHPELLAQTLERSVAGLAAVMEQIRVISRGVRTPSHGDDLPVLLAQMGTAFAERTRLAVTVDTPADRPTLSPAAATALYRVAQQALDNVERHARAARVDVVLSISHRRATSGTRLIVRDDGRGFQVAAVEGRAGRGIGLLNMRERVEALGGWLTIRSSASGTEIDAFMPDRTTTEEDDHDDDG